MECRLNPSVIFSSFLYFLGSRPPLQVLSKGGVNVSLLFTEVIFKHLVDYYLFFLFFFSPLSSSLLPPSLPSECTRPRYCSDGVVHY